LGYVKLLEVFTISCDQGQAAILAILSLCATHSNILGLDSLKFVPGIAAVINFCWFLIIALLY